MSRARALDVSALPSHAFGLRSALVWGALLAIAIEGTVMALLVVSFIYYRGNEQVWPPSALGGSAFRLAAAQMGFLIASMVPTVLMNRAAVRERFHATRRYLVGATLLSLAVTLLRALELARISFRWDENAYASAFWVALGTHVTHVVSGVAEFLMLGALMYAGRHRFEKKHFVDVQCAGLLWYFVVIEWAIAYPVLYLMPLVAGR